jgi:hypothetical protein
LQNQENAFEEDSEHQDIDVHSHHHQNKVRNRNTENFIH